MKKAMLALALLVVGATAVSAQTVTGTIDVPGTVTGSIGTGTTYTLNKAFTCDAVGYYPATTFSEFTCRVNNPLPQNYYELVYPNFIQTDCVGIVTGANGNPTFIPPSCQAEVYLWGGVPRLYVITSQFSVTNATFKLTQFSVAPATFTITWQGTESNGTPHNGTLTATWGNVELGRWWHAALETSTLSVIE